MYKKEKKNNNLKIFGNGKKYTAGNLCGRKDTELIECMHLLICVFRIFSKMIYHLFKT